MQSLIANLKANKKLMAMAIFVVVFFIAFIVANIYNATSDNDEVETTVNEDGEVVELVEVSTSEEIVAADSYTPAFYIGDTTLYLGSSTVQDIVDAGATFDGDDEASVIDFSEDPYAERLASFTYGSTTLYALVQNVNDAIAPLSESVVYTVYWDGAEILASGGIAVGDTIDVLVASLGTADSYVNSEDYEEEASGELPELSRVYLYTDNSGAVTLKISVDRNTYEINYIEETTPDMLIASAAQFTAEQFELLTQDILDTADFEKVYYKEDDSSDTRTVIDVSFTGITVAAGDTTYLFVEYVAKTEEGNGYGVFAIENPILDASGFLRFTAEDGINSVYSSYDNAIAQIIDIEEYTVSEKTFDGSAEETSDTEEAIEETSAADSAQETEGEAETEASAEDETSLADLIKSSYQ